MLLVLVQGHFEIPFIDCEEQQLFLSKKLLSTRILIFASTEWQYNIYQPTTHETHNHQTFLFHCTTLHKTENHFSRFFFNHRKCSLFFIFAPSSKYLLSCLQQSGHPSWTSLFLYFSTQSFLFKKQTFFGEKIMQNKRFFANTTNVKSVYTEA